jgi:acyl-CoA thioester hydrolase
MRGPDLLVEAHVQVAFVSDGRARRIPEALRNAMAADQEVTGRGE